MAFPFEVRFAKGVTSVAIDVGLPPLLSTDSLSLATSNRTPRRLDERDWPEGLAASVDHRLAAGEGGEKGRVLYLHTGPMRYREPVAVVSWHFHEGNWPLTILDMGYRLDLDVETGRALVERVLLRAFADLNAHPKIPTTKVARPNDHFAWMVTNETGAGTKGNHCKAIATRAQLEWGFVSQKGAQKPAWARSNNGKGGFYGVRAR